MSSNIFGFNSHINAIIGDNRKGKSNLFKHKTFKSHSIVVCADRLASDKSDWVYHCVDGDIDVSEKNWVKGWLHLCRSNSIANMWKYIKYGNQTKPSRVI